MVSHGMFPTQLLLLVNEGEIVEIVDDNAISHQSPNVLPLRRWDGDKDRNDGGKPIQSAKGCSFDRWASNGYDLALKSTKSLCLKTKNQSAPTLPQRSTESNKEIIELTGSSTIFQDSVSAKNSLNTPLQHVFCESVLSRRELLIKSTGRFGNEAEVIIHTTASATATVGCKTVTVHGSMKLIDV